jgi:hypothetical protein
MTTTGDLGWVSESCTLPTAEQPLRLAEFDDLFASALRGQRRLSPTALRWDLDPAAESRARDLAGRESSCCSFFTFTFRAGAGAFEMDVEVPAAHVDVLDALAERGLREARRAAPESRSS